MARMMPPLRLPCCQPGARASWRTGSGNLRPVLSADAVFIAHLCQSLHCCGAPHEATAEGWGRSGPHPWWTPWHTVYDARPLHEHVRWDHHASHRRAPEHIGVYPVPITMPTSGPSPSPHRPRGSVPAWIRRCRVAGAMNPAAARSAQRRSISFHFGAERRRIDIGSSSAETGPSPGAVVLLGGWVRLMPPSQRGSQGEVWRWPYFLILLLAFP